MVAVLVEYIRSLNQFEIEVEVRGITEFWGVKCEKWKKLLIKLFYDLFLGVCLIYIFMFALCIFSLLC